MSFTRRLKYSNIVMKRSIKKKADIMAVGLLEASAESWSLLGLAVLAVYVMSAAINTM